MHLSSDFWNNPAILAPLSTFAEGSAIYTMNTKSSHSQHCMGQWDVSTSLSEVVLVGLTQLDSDESQALFRICAIVTCQDLY